MIKFKEVTAKSVLQDSKLPDCDYVINPYTGCAFGCTYCYASFMGRFVGEDVNDWGNYVFAKVNAPELLKKELSKIPNKGKNKTLFFSSVTDPYQGFEAKYKLTRRCLEVLVDYKFEGTVGILTKSPLVLRGIDIFVKLKNPDVGLTITSTDDSISRYFEKNAPNVSERFKALKELNKNSIPTYAFVGPLLPHFVNEEGMLDELFKRIKDAGTSEVYVEDINLRKYILERFLHEMKDIEPAILEKFYLSKNKSYRDELNILIDNLVKKYDLKIRLGGTIYHNEEKN